MCIFVFVDSMSCSVLFAWFFLFVYIFHFGRLVVCVCVYVCEMCAKRTVSMENVALVMY